MVGEEWECNGGSDGKDDSARSLSDICKKGMHFGAPPAQMRLGALSRGGNLSTDDGPPIALEAHIEANVALELPDGLSDGLPCQRHLSLEAVAFAPQQLVVPCLAQVQLLPVAVNGALVAGKELVVMHIPEMSMADKALQRGEAYLFVLFNGEVPPCLSCDPREQREKDRAGEHWRFAEKVRLHLRLHDGAVNGVIERGGSLHGIAAALGAW